MRKPLERRLLGAAVQLAWVGRCRHQSASGGGGSMQAFAELVEATSQCWAANVLSHVHCQPPRLQLVN